MTQSNCRGTDIQLLERVVELAEVGSIAPVGLLADGRFYFRAEQGATIS